MHIDALLLRPRRNGKIIELENFDGFVKSPKIANFKISHLIISRGYEIEIR